MLWRVDRIQSLSGRDRDRRRHRSRAPPAPMVFCRRRHTSWTLLKDIPLRRLNTAEDIGRTVLWFSSPRAARLGHRTGDLGQRRLHDAGTGPHPAIDSMAAALRRCARWAGSECRRLLALSP